MKNRFQMKTLSTILYSFVFLITNSSVWATYQEIENLTSYQAMLLDGTGSQKLNDQYSQKVINQVNAYIRNPSNKTFLKSPKGSHLLENHQKLVNFKSLKDNLENCLSDDEDNLMLRQRVIDAAGKSFDIPVPCRADITKYDELNGFVQSIMSPTDKYLENSFEAQLNNNAIKTTLKTLLSVLYKYDPSFMKNGTLSKSQLSRLTNRVCKKSNICKNTKFKNELEEELKSSAMELAKNEKKRSIDEVEKNLNGKIDLINKKLSKISFEAKERWYWSDYAQMEDTNQKVNFQNYIKTYLQEASQGDGALLLTDKIKDNDGGLKSYSDDSSNIEQVGDKFVYKKHKRVKKSHIRASIKEVEKKIYEQIDSLNSYSIEREKDQSLLKESKSIGRAAMANQYKKKRFKSNRLESIEDLIKRNPIVAGQTLLQNPEYSSLACKAIANINSDKESDENIHKAAILIGAIGGGLLIATGVGAVAGGWLLTGSLSAGVAAGTVGGTVLAATTTSALILGGAESAYFSNKAYNNYSQAQALDRSIMAQTSDQTNIIERRDEVIAFKEARFEAALALGFSALDLGAMKGIGHLAKGSKSLVLSANQRRNLKNLYEGINDPNSLSVIRDAMDKMGTNSSSEFDNFLGLLSTGNKKWQDQFLSQLKDGKLDADKLSLLAKESLEKSKQCIK
ncbi:hypothetical protein [Halobacteriovorax sp. HLS]|uniref:hypothetical protein n=1 Tax=Halobacteriovorax sp. HLS TaxID=2234000 RepID=UPI000FDCB6E2|nr:hypothetical protein [Halobacteriovorax sp. HLS]